MSSTHPSNSLERLVERTQRVAGGIAASVSSAAGGRLRPTAGGGLLAVLVSATISVAAALALGETVRIRWSVGTYYGPEHAPATLALASFPVLVALTFLGLRALGRGLERAADGEFDRVRGIYELCVLATLTTLVLSQVAFVAANLLWG
ncbi:hypothetical protein [Natrinema sp. 1APR25-10V2]|uniref:hypothetical protein n=1 Tax=Natrinema sp. 1APR25-10V2 TaxID=2951081 RepID=UPI002876E943|nr:hypothetical protein [Natrinema sp. 1APR25-10V2]MDS0476616.1 hypothetical protein [Natrinema sp. 1APR25-10V2]